MPDEEVEIEGFPEWEDGDEYDVEDDVDIPPADFEPTKEFQDAQLINQLRKENEMLRSKVDAYETPGDIALWYSLNRKQNEFSRALNQFSLKDLDFSGSGKSFERVMALCKSARELIGDIRTVKREMGITGDEEKDKSKRVSYWDQVADKRD